MENENIRDLVFRSEIPRPAATLAAELKSYCRRISEKTRSEATEKTLVDAVFTSIEADYVAFLALPTMQADARFFAARGRLALHRDTFPLKALRQLLHIEPEDGFADRPMKWLLRGDELDGLFPGEPNCFEQAIVLTLPIRGDDLVSVLFVGFKKALPEAEDTVELLDAMLHVAGVAWLKDSSKQHFKSKHERVVRAKHEWQSSVDVLSQVICLVDRSGCVVRANRAVEQFGLGKVADVRGRCVWELLAQLDKVTAGHKGNPMAEWCMRVRENWDEHWKTVVERGGIEWLVRGRNKEPLYCIAVNPVNMGTTGSPDVEAHAVLVVDDVSESWIHKERADDGSEVSSSLHNRRNSDVEITDRLQGVPSDHQLNTQEEERSRVARELHDGIGQMLTMMKLQCDCVLEDLGNSDLLCDPASRVKVLRKSLADSIEEVHRVSMNLRPPMLDDLGIGPTLRWFFRECEKSNSAIDLSANIDIDEDTLSAELETEIFRITQEAMNNIVKHAGASHVEYDLRAKDSEVLLVIEDNGVGFDESELSATGAGFRNMLARVTRSGGKFAVEAVPGAGVKLSADWRL